jgi:prefoldin subunit 5
MTDEETKEEHIPVAETRIQAIQLQIELLSRFIRMLETDLSWFQSELNYLKTLLEQEVARGSR